MSLLVAKAKRAERKKIVDSMNDLLPKEEGSKMTPENAAKWAELDTAQESLGKEIAALEKQDTLNKTMSARIDRQAVETDRSADEVTAENAEHRAAFGAWMRRGMNALNDEQRQIISGMRSNFTSVEMTQIRNQMSGVDLTGGGILVPVTLYDQIISAEAQYGGMIDPGVCYNFNTAGGGEIPIPTDDDTSNEGEYLGENKTTTEKEPAFGAVRMQAYVLSSKMVKIPIALLQDSSIDLEGFLARKFGRRLGKRKNRAFTTGSGSSEPMGVLTAATQGKVGAANNSVSYAELIATKHSVDPVYRNGARWMFHDTTLQAIKQLVDGMGRPLWNSGIATKSPDTIDGDAFVINQDMPQIASNAKSIAYGNFQNYYIRNVRQMTMMQLRERFADSFQVAFIAFERNDGNLVDAGTHPIKFFQNAA